jgi:hypothetical protein
MCIASFAVRQPVARSFTAIGKAAVRIVIRDVKVTCHLLHRVPGRFRGFSQSAAKMVKKDAVLSEFENVGVSNLSEGTLTKCKLILISHSVHCASI